jgi:hypothetical protein
MKLLNKKVGKISIIDALMIAGAKAITERVMTPFIGNGTLLSGGVKAVAGGLLSGFVGGKAGDILGTAIIIDAGEDVINFILPASSTKSVRGLLTSPSNAQTRKVL